MSAAFREQVRRISYELLNRARSLGRGELPIFLLRKAEELSEAVEREHRDITEALAYVCELDLGTPARRVRAAEMLAAALAYGKARDAFLAGGPVKDNVWIGRLADAEKDLLRKARDLFGAST